MLNHIKIIFPGCIIQADESGNRRGAQCSLPGIVINNSIKTIVVVGDLPGAPRDWHYYWLGPGTVSNRDTDPKLCDADWMTYQHAKFLVAGPSRTRTIEANHWAPYLFNRTYECKDYQATWGPTVKCTLMRQNWGPQDQLGG